MKLVIAAFLGAGLLLAGRGAAAEEPSSFQWFPSSNLYSGYIADPRRPEFGVTVLAVPDPQIPDSGDRRVGLKLGGRFGLIRFGGWQLDIEPGFVGQFDIEHSLDNIGWDGLYNFLVSTALRDDLRMQIGTKHVSSHVGDEYAERTGRRRIDYTREEFAAGATWQIHPSWRTYGEIGWGFAPREEIGQEPGRLQLGLEHEAPESFGRLGWYAALDLQAMEERDWQADPTLQIGLLVPAGDRRWRVGVGVHDGTVPLGEFYRVDETYVALGLWLTP